MKVSSIIKTPVTRSERANGSAAITGADGSLVCGMMNRQEADAIAHAINSHDALVDMVERLKTSLTKAISMLDDPGLGGENEAEIIDAMRPQVREADELLKGEDG